MSAILLVKTSSLGDVVHNLPVVADIHAALPGATVDWVVEKSFAAIPRLHSGVRRVIPCEIRRWRRTWGRAQTRGEWRAFVAALRADAYDAIVDTQGLVKSAVLARLARGHRFGLDWRSSREPLRLFYDRVFKVPRTLHAIERNRQLCGLALGYEPGPTLDYGLKVAHNRPPASTGGRCVVFLHATSHPSKLWPEDRWIALGRRYAVAGYRTLLPWGTEAEKQRAQRIAAALPDARVPDRMDLDAVADMLVAATAIVGVDTGLTHLAAALDRPVVGIYGVTSPGTTGVYAHGRAVNVGSRAGFPSVDSVLAALASIDAAPDDGTTG